MSVAVFLFLLLGLSENYLIGQEAIVEVEKRTITTYPFSDPDPVPSLMRHPRIYPYFSFDGYSTIAVQRQWTAIRLENEYIRALILPELGGKVYGAIEKSTGQQFIYMNDVIKFRPIALRGPWTSGGLEFNFGVLGHTPTTATPVDYLVRNNSDGSVSCCVGTVDWPSRTRWTVEISLSPDQAFLETKALWHNPTPYDQSYYVWFTSALHARDDLQYIFPGHAQLSHGDESVAPLAWPVDAQGRDLSWYRNNAFGGNKSYFVVGGFENFFGGYWHDLAFGTAQWSQYTDMPGQKIWLWALSPEGGIWERQLTDHAGQYTEPQSGRLLSQGHQEFFAPYSSDTWSQIWFPFKEIGGMVAASPYGVMNVKGNDQTITIGICALQTLDEELVVLNDRKEVLRKRIRLRPMQVHKEVLALDVEPAQLHVTIGHKLSFSDKSNAQRLRRPMQQERVDPSTAEGMYLAGQHAYKWRNFEEAIEKFRDCLDLEPGHVRARSRLSELLCRSGRYDEALVHATRALALQMYDPDANYAYGVASRYLGHLVDAKEALGWAARSPKYRSNANTQIAEILIQENAFDAALDYAERAIDAAKYNLRAHELQAIAYRKQAQRGKAERVLATLTDLDPLNHLIRFERYLWEDTDQTVDAIKQRITNEFPHESFLEAAVLYHQLGLNEDAALILRLAAPGPIVDYWLAYLLRNNDPNSSRSYLERAVQAPPDMVFPFREETMKVLQWAIGAEPDTWKSKYYLSLILWNKGRTREAREMIAACGQTDFAPFYLLRSRLEGVADAPRDELLLNRALALAPDQWRCWNDLIQHYRRNGRNDDALKTARDAVAKLPRHIVLGTNYAELLLHAGQPGECLAVLDKLQIVPTEGARHTHQLFVRANIDVAIENIVAGRYQDAVGNLEAAQSYPERLGTGRPFDPDLRLQQSLLALCYHRLENKERSDQLRKRVVDDTIRFEAKHSGGAYIGVWALYQTGEVELAQKLAEDLKRTAGSLDPAIVWYLHKSSAQEDKAENIERQEDKNSDFRFKVRVLKLLSAN